MNIRSLHDSKDGKEDEDITSSFTGGEKSGLVVQHPTDRLDTPWLGAAPANQPLPKGARKVTVYKNGFRIDNGEFRPLSDPENVKFLDEVKSGYAPKELREQATGPVSLLLEDLRSTMYEAPPPPKYTLYSGEGQCTSSTGPLSDSDMTVDVSRASIVVNSDLPVTTLQFRFYDGTTIRQQFNYSHTLADVYNFVVECAPIERDYHLLSGFPPKPIPTDTTISLQVAGLLNVTLTQKLC